MPEDPIAGEPASEPGPGASAADTTAQELAFALIHELANLIAGVRLSAFMLPDDSSPRALAAASLQLDDLSAKAGALLSQLRPLLAPPDAGDGNPEAVLLGLRDGLEDYMAQGVTLRFAVASPEARGEGLGNLAMDTGLVRSLMLPLVLFGADVASPGGEVEVAAEVVSDGAAVLFSVEDNGSGEEPLDGWTDQAPRGRPLACQIASHILALQGGSLRVRVLEGRTRVELHVPLAG